MEPHFVRNTVPSTLLFLGLSFFIAIPATSQRLDNYRERCRSLLSGHYLNLIDQRERTIADIKSIEASLEKVNANLASAKKKWAQTAKDLQKGSFTKHEATNEQQARGFVSRLETVLAQQANLLSERKSMLQISKEGIKKFELQISGVLNIVNDDLAPAGSYKIKLSYLQECPRYRISCPLPLDQREKLKELVRNMENTEDCKRFANMLE